MRLEGLGQLKKIHLIGTRTRDLPVLLHSASTNYATDGTSGNLEASDLERHLYLSPVSLPVTEK
jgi:hypothetical protein